MLDDVQEASATASWERSGRLPLLDLVWQGVTMPSRDVVEWLEVITKVGGLASAPHRHAEPPDFDALLSEIRGAYPALVRAAYPPQMQELYGYAFPTAQLGLVRLPGSPIGDPLVGLCGYVFDTYDPDEIAGIGLLAIADDANDGGPLCLDFRDGREARIPVVLWDHDNGAVPLLYDSFTAMMASAVHVAKRRPVRELAGLGAAAAAEYYSWWDDD